jgi:aerobic carbon-monoxide dehydrogenase large subunit
VPGLAASLPEMPSILGHAVRRLEDPGILRGVTRYLDDLPLEGVLSAAFVRSPLAHGRIQSVDVSEAAAEPGVVGVFTAADLGLAPIPPMGMYPQAMGRPPLADGVVRFVGEAVAVVVAESRTQATDATGLVVVDYDPLPPLVNPLHALEPGSPILFPEHGSNLVLELDFGSDPGLFDDAEVVVRQRFRNQRLAPVPLEVNGAAAVPEPGGGLTAWVPSQSPFAARATLAGALGLDEAAVRVIAPAVGGGFGAKIPLYPEAVVVGALALRLGRPLRYLETRSESMVALGHGRGQIQDVEIGARRDGTLVALRARLTVEAGAYPLANAFLPTLTRQMSAGVYRIPRVEVASRSVVTNTTPMTAYRGAGRPEAIAMVERAVDLVAAECGLDPAEVRRRNLIPPDAFPYTTPVGAVYDTGEYAAALDEALRLADYKELRAEQAHRRERGDTVQLGVGVSCYVEWTTGFAPTEHSSAGVEPDGQIWVTAGTAPQGQGHQTAFAQLTADVLGMPVDAVDVIHSDTGRVTSGGGTMGSRSLQIGGSAVRQAGEALLAKAQRLAAHLLEAAEEDIVVFEGAGLGVAGSPTTARSWADLAAAAQRPENLPEGMEPGLSAAVTFEQPGVSYPFGAHVAVVEVDTETGAVHLVRHVAVDDCGRVLNPMLVEGQVHGGVAQGAAQALFEEFVYDDEGNPLTATLADYLVPSAAELPFFESGRTETPTPLNPLGAKGIGESGTIGSTPAVHNAVIDALSHLGVRHIDMPTTPERVWRAIGEAPTEPG